MAGPIYDGKYLSIGNGWADLRSVISVNRGWLGLFTIVNIC